MAAKPIELRLHFRFCQTSRGRITVLVTGTIAAAYIKLTGTGIILVITTTKTPKKSSKSPRKITLGLFLTYSEPGVVLLHC